MKVKIVVPSEKARRQILQKIPIQTPKGTWICACDSCGMCACECVCVCGHCSSCSPCSCMCACPECCGYLEFET